MITKNDCMSILVQMSDAGIPDAEHHLKKLLMSRVPPVEVLKFISDNRGIDVGTFYEMLRKNHNKKKSPLYKNIVSEETDPEEAVLTLNCLLTQILLFGNKLANKDSFFRAVRAQEITAVLNEYFTEGIYENCVKLLRVIKADLLVLEYIEGRRELE